MAKPVTRRPSTAASSEAAPAVPTLAPAEDNGRPFGEQPAPRTTAPAGGTRRSGKQLGLRIPDDLYERLVAVSESTGIPQSTLVRRALDKELASLEK
jgi:hypothetical protein